VTCEPILRSFISKRLIAALVSQVLTATWDLQLQDNADCTHTIASNFEWRYMYHCQLTKNETGWIFSNCRNRTDTQQYVATYYCRGEKQMVIGWTWSGIKVPATIFWVLLLGLSILHRRTWNTLEFLKTNNPKWLLLWEGPKSYLFWWTPSCECDPI
jgi:uncharacterized membrane protein YraQ (UPF0718 family)